jgi:hypothetical protein
MHSQFAETDATIVYEDVGVNTARDLLQASTFVRRPRKKIKTKKTNEERKERKRLKKKTKRKPEEEDNEEGRMKARENTLKT